MEENNWELSFGLFNGILFGYRSYPDGNKIEFSAELEHMDINHPVRHWPHDRRTLNLWGNAWMRD